jgi:KDO2-lipid IV(A) lauroyltransferase
METVANPRIQRYVYSSRATIGVRIVTLEEAGPILVDTLRRDEPVGLVADRDITGGGIEVEMFGARTKIPAGPVVLAVESGAPVYVAAVRRDGPGRYRGKLYGLKVPEAPTRRERSRKMIREEAKLFERLISDAPEQWLALFQPVWPDLESTPAALTLAPRTPGGAEPQVPEMPQ